MLLLLVAKRIDVLLVFRLLPHHLLYDGMLHVAQILLVGVAHVVLNKLPRVCVYVLLVHLLLQQLRQILLVVCGLISVHLRLLLHVLEPIQDILIDIGSGLLLNRGRSHLPEHLIDVLLRVLPLEKLLDSIHLLVLPYQLWLNLVTLIVCHHLTKLLLLGLGLL